MTGLIGMIAGILATLASENAVADRNQDSVGFLYEIVDCGRMAFSSVRDRRSARTGAVRASAITAVRSVELVDRC